MSHNVRSEDDVGRVARVLATGQRYLLPLHPAPDGDSVGSVLGLARVLRHLGKQVVTCYERDPVPPMFAFLPGSQDVVPLREVEDSLMAGDFSTVVFLDMTDAARAGERTSRLAGELKRQGALMVNIDHHATNSGFGDVRWVDADAPAVGEMVLHLFAELLPTRPPLAEMRAETVGAPGEAPTEVPAEVAKEVADCLYTALLTDTGSFAYDNSTPRAFRAAARLVEMGASPVQVARQVYESRSLPGLRLLGQALTTLSVEAEGRVAYLSVTRDMMQACGATVADTEGLINYPRSLVGVEVALLFREEDDGRVKVGLRSRTVDVAALARGLGGGGHPRAAGCMLPGPLAGAREVVLSRVRAVLPAGSVGP